MLSEISRVDTGRKIVLVVTCTWNQTVRFIEADSRMVSGRGWGKDGRGRSWSKVRSFGCADN